MKPLFRLGLGGASIARCIAHVPMALDTRHGIIGDTSLGSAVAPAYKYIYALPCTRDVCDAALPDPPIHPPIIRAHRSRAAYLNLVRLVAHGGLLRLVPREHIVERANVRLDLDRL